MMIILLDAIGFMNCFCKKKLRLFSSMLSFISSNFTCNLLNFARCHDKLWKVSLSFDIVFWSRNSVIFNSGKYVSMSVSNIISFDCILMFRIVSLHLSFNSSLPVFLIVILCWCRPSHSTVIR